jgi:RNA polymerase sigma-70 factor (ECF subfamily)
MPYKDYAIRDLQHRIAVFEDEIAYKQLFIKLFPSIQNFVFSIVKSRELAEEIASDILIKVWTGRAGLMQIENLKLYLFIAARNLAIRKINQEKQLGERFPLDQLAVEFISDYANPEESAELNELENKIREAIRKLPPRCQIIFKLAKEDKLKYGEIADLLQVSIKTVDNQLSIALKKIAPVVRAHLRKKD